MRQEPSAQGAGVATPGECDELCLAGVDALGAAASAALDVETAGRNDAPRLAGTEGVEEQNNADKRDFAAVDAHDKAFAKAAALAGRAGFTLHQLAGGGYLLGRWTMARECPDLRSVRALLAQMGVRQ